MHSETHLEQTLEVIGNQFYQAWLYFYAAKHLEQADLMGCLRYLYSAVYWACIDDAILVFSRLLLKNPDSVTLHNLLYIAENQSTLFKFATPEIIKESVANSRVQLEGFTPLFEVIKTQRDKMLAHLDKKHVNDLDDILAIPLINFYEVENCLHETLKIFNVYKGFYDQSKLYLGDVEDNLREDVEYLSSLIAGANQ